MDFSAERPRIAFAAQHLKVAIGWTPVKTQIVGGVCGKALSWSAGLQ